MRIGKLEERLAMEKDPQVRNQLQALIEQRKRKREKFWNQFKIPEAPQPTPEQARRERRDNIIGWLGLVIAFAIGGVVTYLVARRLAGDDLMSACFWGFLGGLAFALVAGLIITMALEHKKK